MKYGLSKRKWCYTQYPSVYQIEPHDCGNAKIEWSEWKGLLWCSKCNVDFVPRHWGILDGPIPINLANMMGIRFDRYDLKKNTVLRQEETFK